MILLNAENLSKGYSDRQLLDGCSLAVNEGDKIGLIGVNGTGKSTLLKIIAGLDFPDSGTVTRAGGVRVAYLPQNPVFSENATVLEQVMKGVAISEELAEEAKVRQQADEYQCKTILTKLGLNDYDQKISLLSGGQKRRVAMACALAAEAEVLILDEPTNHIDSEMVDWLESYLKRFAGAVLMVTHDRYFLERVVNRIVELDHGKLYSYPANYSQYLELKAQREEMQLATERKRQSLYRKELAWIQRGARARSTKQQFRVNRFEELKNSEYVPDNSKMEVSALSSRLGKKIIEIENISKSFDGKVLVKDFSYNLLKGDRVGIIGPNGYGKSTLVRMICGVLEPDSGTVVHGDTVKIGYFSQESFIGSECDPSTKAIDYIKSISQEIDTPEGKLTASQMMEKFLFSSDLQYTEIGRLSGGERRRLYLLRVLMEAPNVLVLDEPTNDLDIETLSVLEDYLEEFPGVVIAVSHDRYFLDKLMNHVFVLAGDGQITHYTGGYADYRADVAAQEKAKKAAEPAKAKTTQDGRNQREKLKFSFKEQREYEQIDEVIASLEEKIQQTEKDIAANSSDYGALQELTEKKEQLETELAEKMERWVYLNDLAERIEAQKKQ
ncbi:MULTISPECIES: ABC-F family ATP-binding cassette domain-containing protein [Bacillota]|nr:ABC-F family ATP-binding cassette domain-containing protein [Negativibacillus massiliensis]CDA75843.1 aBC transporter related protein [Clostridium sp. CAG:242]